MLAAFTPLSVSTPLTVATQGAAFAVHCFTSRSLSASGTAEMSMPYQMLGGIPTPSSQLLMLRQKIRPGPTLVGGG
jgi:hypothetical protein